MAGTASVVLSVEDPQELLIELFMQEKKVPKLIFWPLIILEEDQFINLLVDEEDLVVSVLGEEEDHLDRFNLNLMCLCLQSSYLH